MPEGGIEPPRPLRPRILSPVRLPIPPLRQEEAIRRLIADNSAGGRSWSIIAEDMGLGDTLFGAAGSSVESYSAGRGRSRVGEAQPMEEQSGAA